MRILLVAGSYRPDQCGVGDYTESLANALSETQTVKIGVLTTVSPDRGFARSSSVELMDIVNQWTISELLKIVSKVHSWKPDIVHFQYPSKAYIRPAIPSFLPLIFRLLNIRVIQTWHEPHSLDPAHRIKSFLYFNVLTLGALGLIFVRPNYMRLLPRIYSWLIKKIPSVLIPNASPLPLSSLNPSSRSLLRNRYLGKKRRLVIFFGFINPNKGVDLLFDIASPSIDSLVIIGSSKDHSYLQRLIKVARSKAWSNENIHWTGYLSPQDSADLLAVADAVVLPFLDGGGEWNTSIHAAIAQGTLVITTSVAPRGYELSKNLYTAAPFKIDEMRAALNLYAGQKTPSISSQSQWHEIAKSHVVFYNQILRKSH